jgi:hypothetical protein
MRSVSVITAIVSLAAAVLAAPRVARAEPEVGWYEPVPASYGQPLTIRGSGLGNGAGRVLKWGTGTTVLGEVPSQAIASWSNKKIELGQLPIHEMGIYWIAVYQGATLESNRAETLYVEKGSPKKSVAVPENGPRISGSALNAAALKRLGLPNDPDPGGQVPQIEMQKPDYTADMQSILPSVVDWEDKFRIKGSGFGATRGSRTVKWMNAHEMSGVVSPADIVSWKDDTIRIVNRLPKSSVYGFVLFDGGAPVSNMVVGLQVREDSPLGGPVGPPQVEPAGQRLNRMPTATPVRPPAPNPGGRTDSTLKRVPHVKVPAAKPKPAASDSSEEPAVEAPATRLRRITP